MISLQSKTTIESKVMPGVKFTVRALNRIQRAKRDLPVMATRQRLSALVSEYGQLSKIPEDQRTPDQAARLNGLDAEFSMLRDRDVKPADLRAGLVSIEGLEIDGVPATVDSLIDSTGADYDPLIEEMHAACESAAGLSATETKNSQSDSTSTEPAGVSPTTSSVIAVVS